MADLDFTFIKNRSFGDLIQDYLSLIKRIFRHFNASVFKFLLPFLAIFLVLFFLAGSLGVDIFYSKDFNSFAAIGTAIVIFVLIAFFYFLFIPTFGIEYMFLLKEHNSTDFSASDVWRNVRRHLGKYIIFALSSFVVMLILAIPVGLVALILFFIPIIGNFAFGILMACLNVVISCALFLYLKDRFAVFDSFFASFRLLKKKFFAYGIAAYIFRLLLQICLLAIAAIPTIIIGIIAYNTVGFNEQIFITFTGKIFLSLGATLFTLVITVSSIYVMTFYTLIYFSCLEATNKEGTLEEINLIGRQEDSEEK